MSEHDATDLFEAFEAALVEGTPTLSLQNGRIWIDGETAFDASTLLSALSRRPDAPRAREVDDFCQRVADSDWLDADLNAVAVNVLYSRIPDAETRRTAVSAIRTLQDILRDAKAIPAPPQADGAQG